VKKLLYYFSISKDKRSLSPKSAKLEMRAKEVLVWIDNISNIKNSDVFNNKINIFIHKFKIQKFIICSSFNWVN